MDDNDNKNINDNNNNKPTPLYDRKIFARIKGNNNNNLLSVHYSTDEQCYNFDTYWPTSIRTSNNPAKINMHTKGHESDAE